MADSRNIADYFPAEFAQLRADVDTTFRIYLYFEQNKHLILWKPAGERLGADFLARYAQRGLMRVWIHKDDRQAFMLYVNGAPEARAAEAPAQAAPSGAETAAPDAQAAEADAADEADEAPEAPAEPPRTEEGAFLAAVLNNDEIPDSVKEAVVAEAAQEIISDAAEAETVREQAENNEKLREIVQDVLESTGKQANTLVAEIWKMADVDPDLEHAVNVATYSVVFSMAFGKIDPALVADLAMAGLLHDLGVCRVDGRVTSKAWSTHSPGDRKTYVDHVEGGLALLKQFVPDAPQRVAEIIHQTHEKFDGTGYPMRRKGFNLDDVAQLVALAELVDSIACGQWDGETRTMRDALRVIEGYEKKKTFPEFFNPEVFSAVIRWTKTAPDAAVLAEAAKTVGGQAKAIIEKT